LPSVKALHFGPLRKMFGNQFPILGTVFCHCRAQCIVLGW
jgi:hypothetical protein